jgi:hypothetical protein
MALRRDPQDDLEEAGDVVADVGESIYRDPTGRRRAPRRLSTARPRKSSRSSAFPASQNVRATLRAP